MTGSRRDFSKLNRQNQISKYGHEAVDGGWLAPAVPRKKPSKAELREQLASAAANSATMTKHLKCACGHTNAITVSADDMNEQVPCPRCDRRLR